MSGTRTLPAAMRRWVLRGGAPDEAAALRLADALALPLPLCRLLALRGQADADAARLFLKPKIDGLHPHSELTDCDRAVERLLRAVRDGERILVHGDYDVDGICAAALYTRVLRSLGATVEPFVPHRMTDGYDLGHAGIRRAAEVGATLILTGDCGIVAHDAVQAAVDAGIDVIVTDHHTPGADLPAAVAVVNPNRADCRYPMKGLAGAGVAFKLCEALVEATGGDRDALLWHLDLVALATVADLAPLRDENRILVHYGLRVLQQTKCRGLAALMSAAGVGTDAPITAGQLSHVLAPRINAAGRVGAAARGLALLLTDDDGEAERLAGELEAENRTRQALDRQMLADALAMLEQTFDPARDRAVVLSAEGWHPGVIGIVASRVVEHVHRPVVMIAEDRDTGTGRGSARSIPAFDLYAGISACGHLLDRFGGHRQAAGLDIRIDRIDAFRAALNEHAAEMLSEDDLSPEVNVDLEVKLAEADARLCSLLRHVGPFGLGNPQPVFVARGVHISGEPRELGEDRQHVRLLLEQDGCTLPAIGFRLAETVRALDATAPIDVAFQLQLDRWKGRERLQAKLVDVRAAA